MPDGLLNPAGRTHGNGDTRLGTLSNGLTVIVREDHSAPVASVQAWAKTGSIHEGKWLGAGLSHILEHMLFKGTESRGVGRIDQEVQESGGYMNAYTSFDRTVYYIDVPNDGAPVAIDILCDIMQHATLPEAELDTELDVIRREIDMGQDDPGRRASRRLFEIAYTTSPYRHTVIGYPDIFNELRRDDIVGYYRQRYIPANVFYVIVGDVQAGPEMHFGFSELIEHICRTRSFTAGTILGSGTVSTEGSRDGSSCLSERRMLEIISDGEPQTPWMKPGDRVQMRNGELFINDQRVPKIRSIDFIYERNGQQFSVPRFMETLPGGPQHDTLDFIAGGEHDTTQEFVVPPAHYFTMGDNRDNSLDSRARGGVGHARGRGVLARGRAGDPRRAPARAPGGGRPRAARADACVGAAPRRPRHRHPRLRQRHALRLPMRNRPGKYQRKLIPLQFLVEGLCHL